MRGRLKGREAVFTDYERFFEQEALHKFSASEVGFQSPAHRMEHCGGCYHWFTNPASGWTPCEIMRLGGRQPVPSGGVCRFFTHDGKTYPLLNVL